MALYHIAIANRKGGVGKSTVALALAYMYASVDDKKVLLLDLDTQCNLSLSLLGGEKWSELRRNDQLISGWFDAILDQTMGLKPDDFVCKDVGDVELSSGSIDLVAGSVEFEDIQQEFRYKFSRDTRSPIEAESGVVGPLYQHLLRLSRGRGQQASYDVVIYDCPPGLSPASLAALKSPDHVIVPFKPDYVSLHGIELLARSLYGVVDGGSASMTSMRQVLSIPKEERKYTCLANYVFTDPDDRRTDQDRFIINDIVLDHPTFETVLPASNDIRDSIDWMGSGLTLEQKFGESISHFQNLYNEIKEKLHKTQAVV